MKPRKYCEGCSAEIEYDLATCPHCGRSSPFQVSYSSDHSSSSISTRNAQEKSSGGVLSKHQATISASNQHVTQRKYDGEVSAEESKHITGDNTEGSNQEQLLEHACREYNKGNYKAAIVLLDWENSPKGVDCRQDFAGAVTALRILSRDLDTDVIGIYEKELIETVTQIHKKLDNSTSKTIEESLSRCAISAAITFVINKIGSNKYVEETNAGMKGVCYVSIERQHYKYILNLLSYIRVLDCMYKYNPFEALSVTILILCSVSVEIMKKSESVIPIDKYTELLNKHKKAFRNTYYWSVIKSKGTTFFLVFETLPAEIISSNESIRQLKLRNIKYNITQFSDRNVQRKLAAKIY